MSWRAALAVVAALFSAPSVWAGPGEGVFAFPASSLKEAPAFETHGDKPTLIILFQPECAWCLIQFRETEAFKMERPDIGVVALSLRGARRDLNAELRKAKTSIPAYQSSPRLLEALGDPDTTPRLYWATSDGRLMALGRGKVDRDQLEAIADVLSPRAGTG